MYPSQRARGFLYKEIISITSFCLLAASKEGGAGNFVRDKVLS